MTAQLIFIPVQAIAALAAGNLYAWNEGTKRLEPNMPAMGQLAKFLEASSRALVSAAGGADKITGDRFDDIAAGRESILIGENVTVGTRFDIGLLANFWLQGGELPLQFMTKDGSMLVMGPGFGAVEDLLFWFGAFSADASVCTKENCVFAFTTDGKIYQDGALISNDVLTSSAESTSPNPPTFSIQTIHGPGDTANGNDITVRASYELLASGSSTSGWGNPSAQLKLYETIGAGVEALIDTYDIPGDFGTASAEASFEPPGLFYGFQRLNGTVEVVRSNSAATARTFRWELTARSISTGLSVSQRLAINTTEQP